VDVQEHPAVGLAFVLILLGSILLLNNLGLLTDFDLDIDALWPGLIVLAGVAFLIQFLLGGTRDPGFIFIGVGAILLGLFFFLFTLNVELPYAFVRVQGPLEWRDLSYLWPVLPIIGGIALIAMALFGGDQDALGAGLIALTVGLLALPFTLGSTHVLRDMEQYWPVVLIFIGGGLLLQQLGRRSQR
jgi:hypothetical protein